MGKTNIDFTEEFKQEGASLPDFSRGSETSLSDAHFFCSPKVLTY